MGRGRVYRTRPVSDPKPGSPFWGTADVILPKLGGLEVREMPTIRRDLQAARAALRRLRAASAEQLTEEDAAGLVAAAEALLPSSRWRIEDESGGTAIFSGPADERRARWFCEQVERGRV